jgi:hypothetical protein
MFEKTRKIQTSRPKRNQDITKKLKTETVLEKINNYKIKWIQHVSKMDSRYRPPNAIMKYQTERKRNP